MSYFIFLCLVFLTIFVEDVKSQEKVKEITLKTIKQ